MTSADERASPDSPETTGAGIPLGVFSVGDVTPGSDHGPHAVEAIGLKVDGYRPSALAQERRDRCLADTGRFAAQRILDA